MANNSKINIPFILLLVSVVIIFVVGIQRSLPAADEQAMARQAMIERDRYFAERQRQIRARKEKENELKYLVSEIHVLKNNCKKNYGCGREQGVFELFSVGAYNEKWGESRIVDWHGPEPFKDDNRRTVPSQNSDPLRSGIITMNMNSCRNSVKQGAIYRGVDAVVVIDTNAAYIARVPITRNRYDAYDLVTCSRPDGTRGVKRIKV